MSLFNKFIFLTTLIFLLSCGKSNIKQVESQNSDSISAIVNANTKKYILNDKTVKFLWLEKKDGNEYLSMILNKGYCDSISDPERAALGFVATFIGNECWWDGEANVNRSNLKCTILSALDLGYQCSEEHLGFLRKWFRNDSASLKLLEDCPTTPYTSTVQETFEEIIISTQGNEISVTYQARAINYRDDYSKTWKQTDNFILQDDNLMLVKSLN